MTRIALLSVLALTVAPVGVRGAHRGSAPRSPSPVPQAATTDRTRALFDFDWKFTPGEAAGAQAPTFDDASWEKVDLPHDFMIRGQGQAILIPTPNARGGGAGGRGRGDALPTTPEGPFDPRSPGRADAGYLNAGIGWYRKTFTLPSSESRKRVFIEFEGVYMNSDVWVNGVEIGKRPYGYSTFQYDITPRIRFGQPNVIAVRVDVQQPSSRWYSGAGIYRHVWLTTTNPVHVDHWGTYVTTPVVSASRASVRVRVGVRNQNAATLNGRATVTLRDRDGRAVGAASAPLSAPADSVASATVDIDVARPHRWSIDDPYLYSADVRVRAGNRDVDATVTPFGIRTIAFTSDSAFALNGVHVPFRGVCLHHDLGPLGAAAFDRGIERELQIMKAMGVNAIRTSHNPPTPVLLDLADRMGFVVMDETFDEWKRNKTRFGYGQFFDEWSERDIRDHVRRDRNHPSVVMWSIGNEIPEQGDTTRTADGRTRTDSMASRLATFVRMEDSTRFITSAMNSPQRALRTGFATSLDAFGVNYNLGVYPTVKGRPSYASETSSDFSSRDQYNLVLDADTIAIQHRLDNHVTSYDLEGPGWGNSAEVQFAAMRDAPWIGGEFVWTGVDYIGEPTPFSWPNRSSSFGIVDLGGFPKDRFYLYQSQWRPGVPMVHLLPRWNWPESWRGKAIPVWAYTNADSVELFLNEKSRGTRGWSGVAGFHLEWKVPYEPGALRARAWKSGRVVAEDHVETTTAPAKLALVVDRATIRADGEDLAYVTVRVLDANGRLCRAEGEHTVHFTLAGGGSIAGVDNGDPTNHEPFVGPTPATASHKAFNGLEVVIIRAPRRGTTMTLSASADGLAPAKAAISAR